MTTGAKKYWPQIEADISLELSPLISIMEIHWDEVGTDARTAAVKRKIVASSSCRLKKNSLRNSAMVAI